MVSTAARGADQHRFRLHQLAFYPLYNRRREGRWPAAARIAAWLRKALCVRLADARCDVFEIMAITDRTDRKEMQTYVAAANKKRQARSAIAEAKGAV